MNFGEPDVHLAHSKASVILFFVDLANRSLIAVDWRRSRKKFEN